MFSEIFKLHDVILHDHKYLWGWFFLVVLFFPFRGLSSHIIYLRFFSSAIRRSHNNASGSADNNKSEGRADGGELSPCEKHEIIVACDLICVNKKSTIRERTKPWNVCLFMYMYILYKKCQ